MEIDEMAINAENEFCYTINKIQVHVTEIEQIALCSNLSQHSMENIGEKF